MRDLETEELGHVYGAGGRGSYRAECKPCAGSGSKSRGRGSKGGKSRSKGGKSRSRGSKGRCS